MIADLEVELAEQLAALWQRHRDEPYTMERSLADDEDDLIDRFARWAGGS